MTCAYYLWIADESGCSVSKVLATGVRVSRLTVSTTQSWCASVSSPVSWSGSVSSSVSWCASVVLCTQTSVRCPPGVFHCVLLSTQMQCTLSCFQYTQTPIISTMIPHPVKHTGISSHRIPLLIVFIPNIHLDKKKASKQLQIALSRSGTMPCQFRTASSVIAKRSLLFSAGERGRWPCNASLSSPENGDVAGGPSPDSSAHILHHCRPLSNEG